MGWVVEGRNEDENNQLLAQWMGNADHGICLYILESEIEVEEEKNYLIDDREQYKGTTQQHHLCALA